MILISLVAPHLWLLAGLSILSLSSSSSGSNDNGSTASDDGIINTYLKPFNLELYDFPETGRGIRTLVDRSPGEIVLQVPVDDTVTTMNGIFKDSKSDLGSLISQEQQLAMTLLHLRDKDSHPYVSKVLPKDHCAIWNLPETIWNEMRLPRCYREAFLATRQVVNSFVSSMTEAKNRHDSLSLDDLMWAFSMVRSRSISVPELQPKIANGADADSSSVLIALIPGLDLFNHHFDAGTLLKLSSPEKNDQSTSKSLWTLSSSKAYSAGDQIYLSYGDEKDNWKLLLTYGFSLSDNPQSLVFWTWQDLLEAAGQVRPGIFPPRVQQSLLQHPQLYETYTVLSEKRVTFSYDGKTKQPRESLFTGLQMMASLAVQLGQPHDESLGEAILKQLIVNRRSELEEAIASLQAARADEEWRPFLSSVQLALEEESRYIS